MNLKETFTEAQLRHIMKESLRKQSDYANEIEKLNNNLYAEEENYLWAKQKLNAIIDVKMNEMLASSTYSH